jgi:hypothetical protein
MRSRRVKCEARKQSKQAASLLTVLEQLMDAENLREEYANFEVFNFCMAYVTEHSQWPTPEEIAAATGMCLDHVLEVEERLGGTHEFALRNGLVTGSG